MKKENGSIFHRLKARNFEPFFAVLKSTPSETDFLIDCPDVYGHSRQFRS